MKIPNSFSGTMFNRQRIQFESHALNMEFSKVYFFLPCITDRIEKINRHMGSVNLVSIDMPEDTFEVEGNIEFDPYKLDYEDPEKDKIKDLILKF